MNKLAVSDLDSTLLDGECIDIVLEHIIQNSELKHQLKEIRTQGMSGEIDLESSLNQRIALFEGLPLSELDNVCKAIPWVPNAKSTIATLKRNGYYTVCLSGAFRTITRRVMTELDFDAYCCNTLDHKAGFLTGKITGELMHHQSKGKRLSEIQTELGITPENTIAVGDGANDVSMFEYADKKIAFCAEQMVIEQANCVINAKDLSQVLTFID